MSVTVYIAKNIPSKNGVSYSTTEVADFCDADILLWAHAKTPDKLFCKYYRPSHHAGSITLEVTNESMFSCHVPPALSGAVDAKIEELIEQAILRTGAEA